MVVGRFGRLPLISPLRALVVGGEEGEEGAIVTTAVLGVGEGEEEEGVDCKGRRAMRVEEEEEEEVAVVRLLKKRCVSRCRIWRGSCRRQWGNWDGCGGRRRSRRLCLWGCARS